ncbi:Cu-oxidase-domain-containing protein [Mollisia scopiformis]|uniref:Cu-oxidase-domain-containing protein n=1 Tax=Mollisia scopiformis TaxID=149040 RepID=A0A194X097_MOLSC|nr:Cu-oxidase-domain-containing protein [Mollisia scopiformis]KUJ13616.1 Cu-oxidase-domain-containing protein [Mollisia scopiformis]
MLISRQLLLLSHWALGVLAAKDNLQRNPVDTPQNRSYWSPGFDIQTDYEDKTPPGRLREYELTITQEWIAPDGYLTYGTVFNGRYPGPTIEADWGDTLLLQGITVINNLKNYNGTYYSVPCQDTNGLVDVGGPLIINGPSVLDYDFDLGPWLFSDWYHADAFSLYHEELDTVRNLAPLPDSIVLNGKGVCDCDQATDSRCTGKAEYYEVLVTEGKTYKIAVENTGTLLTLTFFIDGHNFTVIETDFVPIEPYSTNVLNVGIGQRYIILVEANASFEHGTNFWIHAHYCALATFFPTSSVGIIRYDSHNTSDPYTPPASELNQNFGCSDPDPKDLVPIVKRTVGNRVNTQEEADYLKIGLEFWPNASDPNSHIHKWMLQNTPLYLDWEDPSLKKLALDKNSSFPAETVPYFLDFETDEWVYFVITNNYSVETVSPPRQSIQSVHPIHLHGHDLLVLAQGEGSFTNDIVPNLNNPSRRDVTDVPIGGFVWIAFKVDNPGAWLIHCHIAWHASDGLALQFIEQPNKIKGLLTNAGVLPEFSQRCDEWSDWYTEVNEKVDALQEDSGI